MKLHTLRAVEALLCNCHRLAADAENEVADADTGEDAAELHRLAALAKIIKDELTRTRSEIAKRTGRGAAGGETAITLTVEGGPLRGARSLQGAQAHD